MKSLFIAMVISLAGLTGCEKSEDNNKRTIVLVHDAWSDDIYFREQPYAIYFYAR